MHDEAIESPYEQLLGPEFAKLDLMVQTAHRVPLKATGHAKITGASSALGRLLAKVMQLPGAATDRQVSLQTEFRGTKVEWKRRFDGQTMRTIQWTDGTLLFERSGPIRFRFALRESDGGLIYRSVGARIGPVPLPVRVEAEVAIANLGWQAHVRVASPLLGLLCDYTVCLKPE